MGPLNLVLALITLATNGAADNPLARQSVYAARKPEDAARLA